MGRAGFYEIRSSKIRFGKDGRWYADDEPIVNERIASLLSRHLVREPDGTYAVRIGWDRAPVEVEDTPFVVTRVDGDGEKGFVLTLNDGTTEPLDPTTLRVGPDGALSCAVKGGAERARFLRGPHAEIASRIVPSEDGGYVLRISGREYRVDEA
ncbi:MAG: hypothetical protein KatS3mg076_0726 [Candidatus Binatia bacterium]|nr:MAG: hypothetical protein KatS3mg076_0726 [Candidatus Binatia bacterium]